MAGLYLCPSVTWNAGANRLWLPPWLTATHGWAQTVTKIAPARGSRAVIAAVVANLGCSVALRVGNYPHPPEGYGSSSPSQAAVMSWYAQIAAAVKGRKVGLNIYNDRGWQACACESAEFTYSDEPMFYIPGMSLNFFSEQSEPTTASRIEFDDEADYAASYPFAAFVGRPVGDAAEGEPTEAQAMIRPFSGQFDGVNDTPTVVGNEHRYIVAGAEGGSFSVKNLQITFAEAFGATGPTTVRISADDVAADDAGIEATVEDDEQTSALSSGSFTVATGATLYAYIPTAGGHQNVQYRYEAEPL